MPAKSREYRIVFKEKGAQQLQRKTSGIERGFARLKSSLGGVGLALAGAFTATAIFQGIKKVTVMAAEQELIFKKLSTSVNLLGVQYQGVENDLNNMFAELQRTTQYGDTDSAKTLTTLIQLTGSYNKAVESLPITLDLAASGLFSLDGAARAVGMAMSGNVEMLGRYIPQLKSTNPELKKLKTNAEKTALAFNLLNKNFDGHAQANLETTIGQWDRLGNEIGDFSEKIGDAITKDNPAYQLHVKALIGIFSWLNKIAAQSEANENAQINRGRAIGMTTIEIESQIVKLKLQEKAANDAAKSWKKYTDSLDAMVDKSDLSARLEEITVSMEKINKIDLSTSGKLDVSEYTLIGWEQLKELTAETGDILADSLFDQWEKGENAMDAFAKAFKRMLERMVAELASKAIIFGFLNLLTGGTGTLFKTLTGGSFANFLGFGSGQTAAPGGPGVTNITINAVDPRGFEEFLRHRGGGQAVLRVLGEQI